MYQNTGKSRKGFTLIELLIVVAIIAILAAIAIPNFLAAQTRSKVARCKGDLRSVALAVESYYVDNNSYPYINNPVGHWLFIDYETVDPADTSPAKRMTTPIAYITSIPIDQFTYDFVTYRYPFRYSPFLENISTPYNQVNMKYHGAWMLGSAGPGRSFSSYWDIVTPNDVDRILYDPSNGTISGGNIIRSQGGRTPNI